MPNAVVEQFRVANPTIQASDDEITEKLFDLTRDNKKFDSDQAFLADATRIKNERLVKGVTSSVGRGFAQLGNLGRGLGALATDLVGADETSQGLVNRYVEREGEIARDYPQGVPSYQDVGSVKEAGAYALEKIGENIPMALPSLLSGGVGAFALRKTIETGAEAALKTAVEAGVKEGLKGEALQLLGSSAKAAFQKKAYGLIASAAAIPTSVGLEAGSIYPDILQKTGERKPGTALAFGTAAGIFDVLPAGALFARIFGRKAGEEITKGLVARVGLDAAKQVLAEAPTEAIQTMIERAAVKSVDPSYEVFSPEGVKDIIDSFLAGGLAGGVIGGAVGAVTPPAKASVVEEEEPETKLSKKDQAVLYPTLAQQQAQVEAEAKSKQDAEAELRRIAQEELAKRAGMADSAAARAETEIGAALDDQRTTAEVERAKREADYAQALAAQRAQAAAVNVPPSSIPSPTEPVNADHLVHIAQAFIPRLFATRQEGDARRMRLKLEALKGGDESAANWIAGRLGLVFDPAATVYPRRYQAFYDPRLSEPPPRIPRTVEAQLAEEERLGLVEQRTINPLAPPGQAGLGSTAPAIPPVAGPPVAPIPPVPPSAPPPAPPTVPPVPPARPAPPDPNEPDEVEKLEAAIAVAKAARKPKVDEDPIVQDVDWKTVVDEANVETDELGFEVHRRAKRHFMVEEFPGQPPTGETPWTKELDDFLVAGADPHLSSNRKSESKHVVYFENVETGEVVGMTVWRNPKNAVVVSGLKGGRRGMNLKSFLEQKTEDGQEQLWNIHRMIRLKPGSEKEYYLKRYASLKEFTAGVLDPIDRNLGRMAEYEDKVGKVRVVKGHDAEGNPVTSFEEEQATEQQQIDEELVEQLYDAVRLEFVNQSLGGTPKSDLSPDQVGMIAIRAFVIMNPKNPSTGVINPNNAEAALMVIMRSIQSLTDAEKSLKPETQLALALTKIQERIYEAYQHGAFTSFRGRQKGMDLFARALSMEGSTGLPQIRLRTEARAASAARENEGDRARPTNRQVSSGFTAVMRALKARNVPVVILGRKVGDILGIYGMKKGGDRFIALAVTDAANPTLEEFETLLHEAAHHIFGELDAPTQLRIQRAIEAGLRGDTIVSEETLVETMARELAAEGFNATEARNIWSRIWDYVKEAYVRVMMAVQETIYGWASPEIAQQYFNYRAKAWMRGEMFPLDAISHLGGPKPRPDIQVANMVKADGFSYFDGYWNTDRLAMEYPEALLNSLAAAGYNFRYRTLDNVMGENRVSPDLDAAAEAARDVASHNEVKSVVEEALAKMTAAGVNKTSAGPPLYPDFDSFFRNVIASQNYPTSPEAIVAKRNEEIVQIGQKGVDPNLSIGTVNSPATRMQASGKAIYLFRGILSALGAKARDYSAAIITLNSDIKAYGEKLIRLLEKHLDAEVALENVSDGLKDQFTEFQDDFKQATVAAHREGQLSQIIRQIDRQIDSPRAAAEQYGVAIERLFRMVLGGRTRESFVEKLEEIARMDAPWAEMSTGELVEIIRPGLESWGPFRDLETVKEKNALTAIVVAFAKRNATVMDALLMRRASVEENERTLVNEVLREATRDSKTAIADARKKASKLKRLGKAVGRILSELERVKALNAPLMGQRNGMENFIEAYSQFVEPAIRARMKQLEANVGASALQAFEPVDGAAFLVPGSPEMSERELQDIPKEQWSVLDLRADGATQSDIRSKIMQIDAWTDAAEKRGVVGAFLVSMKLVSDKLKQVAGIVRDHQDRRVTWLESAAAPLPDMLDSTGTRLAKAAAQNVRTFNNNVRQWKQAAISRGVKWDNAEAAAMKVLNSRLALPLTQSEFRDRWYTPMLKYMEDRKDIRESSPNEKVAETRAIAAAREYFAKDPGRAQEINAPGFWPAMEEYMARSDASGSFFNTLKTTFGLKVLDTFLGMFRETIGSSLFDMPRKLHDRVNEMYKAMADNRGWVDPERSKPSHYVELAESDPEALRAELQELFSPETAWSFFAREIVGRVRPAFNAPMRPDGTMGAARQASQMMAYQEAQGDPLAFIERLYELEGGTTPFAEFVGETMETFHSFFNTIHALKQQQDSANKLSLENVQHFLMDGRIAEELPAGFLEYATFGWYDSMRTLVKLAEHGAYGRDLHNQEALLSDAAKELKALSGRFDTIVENARLLTTTKAGQLAKMEELAGGKEQLRLMRKASDDSRLLASAEQHWKNSIATYGGFLPDVKGLADGLHVLPALAVQGAATAMTDTITVAEPMLRLGPSMLAGQISKTSAIHTAVLNIGSVLQTIGILWGAQAEKVQLGASVGMGITDKELDYRHKLASIGHAEPLPPGAGIVATAGRRVKMFSRAVREALSTGTTGLTKRSESKFPALRLHALFGQIQETMPRGLIVGVLDAYQGIFLRAIRLLDQDLDALTDPNFKFTAQNLGYKKRFFGFLNDEYAFDYLNAALNKRGMSIETIARDSLRSRQKNTNDEVIPLLSSHQVSMLGSIALDEFTMDSSLTTRPAWMLTNPILNMASPLLGWSINKLTQIPKDFREADGTQRKSIWSRGFAKGWLAYTAIIPIGLAYAALRDEWDEEGLNKKSNVLGFGEGNNYLAVLDRLSRVGTFGLGGDFANAMLNENVNREFSFDSRVFFASSLKSFFNTMGVWIRQEDATYASVGRPLFASLGGSGYLQNFDAMINLLSLQDLPLASEEARVVARINLANELRAAGRQLELNVRPSKAMGSLSNPIKPWIGEMTLAAYADDPQAFSEAHQMAVAAARGEKKENPEQYVKETYQSYNPLTAVFLTKPTEGEYRRMLAVMSERGRESVEGGLRLFNRYGEKIGVTPSFGKKEPVTLSLDAIRRRSLVGSAALR